MKHRVIVGITGASGAIIGVRLVSELCAKGWETHVVVSSAGVEVLRHEVGARHRFPRAARLHGFRDFSSPLNSSSFMADAMAVAPCSMKTLAALACGYADNALVRAADAVLRTGRRLVLVPRETPLSLSALENMAALKRAGAVILPPAAAYYHRPKTVGDMTDFFVGKILDALGAPHRLYGKWGEKAR